MRPPVTHPPRVKALDGLRAFSVSLVVLGHAFPGFYPSHGIGVDVFFVISGFVITQHLLQHQPSFREFYTARLQRLLPPALIVIASSWVMFELGLLETSYLAMIAAALSFLNWLRAYDAVDEGGRWLGHYWSLSIEEQFYLIWPVLLLLFLHRREHLARGLIIAALSVMLWRQVGFAIGFSPERIYNGFDTRADGLLLGCFLAFVRISVPRWSLVAALAAIIWIGALTIDPFSVVAQMRYPLATVLSVVAVAGCVSGKVSGVHLLEHPALQWLGSRSYAVYLWHYPLMGVALGLGAIYGVSEFATMILAIAGTLLASEATFRWVERPLRDARHRRQVSSTRSNPGFVSSS